MSWKKTLNSMAAAQRRAERESLRKQRELQRQQKEIGKMEEFERAKYEVQVYETRVDVLKSVHKDCRGNWDWEKIKDSPPPQEPQKSFSNEKYAQTILDDYKPGLSDKLLKRTETKRIELEKAVEIARKEVEQEYQDALEDYKIQLDAWLAIRELATKILEGNIQAYTDAINQVGQFVEIGDIGSDIQFRVHNTRFIEAELYVNSEDVIPNEVKSILKSGKLSVKNMTKTNYYGLYQDYVCGCVLRVARELFALLPVEKVIVTGLSNLLNTKTGYIENQPILSVSIPKDTLNGLNFDMIDPSDSMENFVYNMKFAKTKGFNAVQKIDSSNFL